MWMHTLTVHIVSYLLDEQIRRNDWWNANAIMGKTRELTSWKTSFDINNCRVLTLVVNNCPSFDIMVNNKYQCTQYLASWTEFDEKVDRYMLPAHNVASFWQSSARQNGWRMWIHTVSCYCIVCIIRSLISIVSPSPGSFSTATKLKQEKILAFLPTYGANFDPGSLDAHLFCEAGQA